MNSRSKRIEIANNEDEYDKYPLPLPSVKYSYPIPINLDVLEIYKDTTIEVIDRDSLDMALLFQNAGLNPVVLNMACSYKPGGGWKQGAGAQEESIFYRSNYCKTLKYEFYPILDAEVIYSPKVTVFRDNDLNERAADDSYDVSLMAIAAIQNPYIYNARANKEDKWDKFKYEYDLILTTQKIELMFQTGIKHSHDSLILSAFGCGAYHNSPSIIVEIFNEMLEKYRSYFKFIVFAVLGNESMEGRSRGDGYKIDNYIYFDRNIIRDFSVERVKRELVVRDRPRIYTTGGREEERLRDIKQMFGFVYDDSDIIGNAMKSLEL